MRRNVAERGDGLLASKHFATDLQPAAAPGGGNGEVQRVIDLGPLYLAGAPRRDRLNRNKGGSRGAAEQGHFAGQDLERRAGRRVPVDVEPKAGRLAANEGQ